MAAEDNIPEEFDAVAPDHLAAFRDEVDRRNRELYDAEREYEKAQGLLRAGGWGRRRQ